MLHSGGDCQAEPNLVQPHFGNLGQVLTLERVRTDWPHTLGICSLAGFVRARDASLFGAGWQILPSGVCGFLLWCLSPLRALPSPSTKAQKSPSHLISASFKPGAAGPSASPGAMGPQSHLQISCTGTDLQTPLLTAGVLNHYFCALERCLEATHVAGRSCQRLERDGPLCFQKIPCVPHKHISVLLSTDI